MSKKEKESKQFMWSVQGIHSLAVIYKISYSPYRWQYCIRRSITTIYQVFLWCGVRRTICCDED